MGIVVAMSHCACAARIIEFGSWMKYGVALRNARHVLSEKCLSLCLFSVVIVLHVNTPVPPAMLMNYQCYIMKVSTSP